MLTLGMKPTEMAAALGTIPMSSIYTRLKWLQASTGIRTNEPWSDVESQKLRSAAANCEHLGDLQQLFPNRTADALLRKCETLKLPAKGIFAYKDTQSWTAAQDAELMRLRGLERPSKQSAQSWAKVVGRASIGTVACGRYWLNDKNNSATCMIAHER